MVWAAVLKLYESDEARGLQTRKEKRMRHLEESVYARCRVPLVKSGALDSGLNLCRAKQPPVSFSIAISICVMLLTLPLFAWEKDFHYGLTLWLGLQAGFSESEGIEIATLTQAEDEGSITPATSMQILALLLADKSASRTVGDKHFPSSGTIPSAPANRIVAPGSKASRYLLNAAIENSEPSALDKFGEALHPFQDSWSHQGEPDVPLRPGPRIHPELAWAHPMKRGGWWSHEADLTAAYPNDCLAAAEATYKAMLEFRRRHPALIAGQPRPWSDLVDAVNLFAKARTKDEKLQWFSSHLSGQALETIDLSSISLPGTTRAERRAVDFIHPIALLASSRLAPVPVLDAATTFFTTWFVGLDVKRAVTNVNLSAVQQEFREGEFKSTEQVEVWCRRFLTMWLVADHGSIEAAGHGKPDVEGFAKLPDVPLREGPFAITRLELPVLRDTVLFRPTLDGIEVFATIISFSDLPYDSAVILFNPKGQIVRMLWNTL